MKESTHKLRKESVGADASVRPCFEGIHKNNKAITLIALIITIVVMMILVGVTVTFTIGENGILQNTKEAKFKQEVSQLIEFVNMEKAAIIAEKKVQGEEEPYTYNSDQINQLTSNISDNLYDKFIKNTDKLCVLEDGNVYYNANKVEFQEAIWLEELEIEVNPGTLTFKQKVEQIVGQIPKIEEYADFDNIVSSIKTKYGDDTCIVYENVDYMAIKDSNNYTNYTEDALNKKIAVKEILKIIEENAILDNTIIETGTNNSSINEIIDIANEHNIAFIESNSVANIKEDILPIYDCDFNLYIASEEGDIVIDINGNVEYSNKITLMSETEVEEMFVLTEKNRTDPDDNDLIMLSINAYKGMEENVRIPDVIYDENGKFTKKIAEIISLNPPLTPVYTLFEMSLESYNSASVETVWNKATNNQVPYPGSEETAVLTDNKTKYEELLPMLSTMNLTEDDVVLYDDYIPYVYAENYTPVQIPFEIVEIETITLSYKVETIGTNAFLRQTSLKEIRYNTPLQRPTISADAFEGCTNLTKIIFTKGKWPLYRSTIEGYETYWGAPNENIKIYDEEGEVEI